MIISDNKSRTAVLRNRILENTSSRTSLRRHQNQKYGFIILFIHKCDAANMSAFRVPPDKSLYIYLFYCFYMRLKDELIKQPPV